MNTLELIDNIQHGDNVTAKKDFDTLMSQKLTAALDAKKIEIASSLGQPVQTEEDQHMLKFNELREKVKLASNEKQVKAMKAGKGNKVDIVITQKGNKFAVYINGDKLDDSFKDAKDAEKNANDFIKLMGEELEQ